MLPLTGPTSLWGSPIYKTSLVRRRRVCRLKVQSSLLCFRKVSEKFWKLQILGINEE